MRIRSDVKFFLLTKRPERILSCLPSDWKDGWENIMINVTAENQKRADERIPILLDLPFKHKGIMCAPLLSEIHIEQYLPDKIEQIIVGGENYNGSRPCHYEWVKGLYQQATKHDITFAFIETGTTFVKDGKTYHIPSKTVQSNKPSDPVCNTKVENTNTYSPTNLTTTFQRSRDTNVNLILTVQNVALNSYVMELS